MEMGKALETPSKVADVTKKQEISSPHTVETPKNGIDVAGAFSDEKKFWSEGKELKNEKLDSKKLDSTKLEKNELTQEQKDQIKMEQHWSDKVINSIRSMEEYEKVYKPANLYEQKVDGRTCLVKNIDMDYVSPKTGLTNREAMAKGMSPCDAKTGERLELHHMGQNYDAPLAELCENSEHGDGNDKILHDKNVESWRNDPQLKNQYQNVDRPNHWKERAEEV